MPRQEPRAILWTEEFQQRQSERLWQIAAKMKLPRRLIEDAVLEVWAKIMRQWESFQGADEMPRFLALSRKIMHDTVVDMIRSTDRHFPASLHDLPVEPVDDKASDPAALSALQELREGVRAKLEELQKEKPSYAWLLSEHFLKERPLEELAVERRVTKHSLECQKSRALEALRGIMGDRHPDGEAAS